MNRIKNFITNTFIGGLVVLLPILIFAFLINWLIGFFGNLVNPIIQFLPDFDERLAKFIAFLLIIGFCFSVGLFIRTRFGKMVFNWFESVFISKLPFYTIIKETVLQFVGSDKTPFKEVVLVKPYGGKAKMMGFVTSKFADGTYSIFILTAPNPTSGFVIFMHEEDVEVLDISVEEAMRTNIGLGRGSEKIIRYKDLKKLDN